ncbi:ASCH domain-containing protein [Actinomyces trachealis]|uniref:ASCH domain-containing protein n=1 Tax=Actinomyces trachealis TaxID=2763540 RepID=UPI001892BEAE|nr:ASCH domain-containing protein [Actinomyces trachealis]
MPLSPEQERYWRAYLAAAPAPPEQGCSVVVGAPGNDENADMLLELYLLGKKTAGSGLLEEYLAVGEPLPRIGDRWIALDSQGRPRCILRTVRVETHRFLDVPERIAVAEGEGDLTLDYWRSSHTRFFAPYLQDWGLSKIEDATVVTEFFELVYA